MINVKSIVGKSDLKVEISMSGKDEELSTEFEYALRAFRSYMSDKIGEEGAKTRIRKICEESLKHSDELIEESDIDQKILEIEDLIDFIRQHREGK